MDNNMVFIKLQFNINLNNWYMLYVEYIIKFNKKKSSHFINESFLIILYKYYDNIILINITTS